MRSAGSQPGVHRLSMTHSGRQRNLMMHAQCPLPIFILSGSTDYTEVMLAMLGAQLYVLIVH